MPNNTTENNWGEESWRKPSIPDGATEIFSEHGRIIREGQSNGCDYRSHWLVVFKHTLGPVVLRVRHGGGEESFSLGWQCAALLSALAPLDSDQRYEALYTVYKLAREYEDKAEYETRKKYEFAFIQGRLKKRKRNNRYYVEVVPENQ